MSPYVYGPVPSRRLGRSLGIDLVPFKTCTYDCIYCQLGRTTRKTIQRREWVPLQDVLEELKAHLATQPDYITISGSGEPTLHAGIGNLIKAIRAVTDIPVAVLTNGSLLWLPEVRDALGDADLVIPSLDAGSERLFRHVNRPHREVTFHKMIDGLLEFRKCFSGQYWLEVLLLGGITGLTVPVKEIAEVVKRISPHRVHVNTVVRPPAESFAIPVPDDLMERLVKVFGPRAEVIGRCTELPAEAQTAHDPQEILALVARRPCTLEDISKGLGLERREAKECVDRLAAAGLLTTEYQAGRLYFKAIHP